MKILAKPIEEFTQGEIDELRSILSLGASCPECRNQLVKRKFVDSWREDSRPDLDEISEDWHCNACATRWIGLKPTTEEYASLYGIF